MKLYFSSDHAGHTLRKALMEYTRTLGYEVIDFGPETLDESDDYPDFIAPLAAALSIEEKKGAHVRGIILGGSGQGEAMVANRFGHVRAGVLASETIDIVRLLREHNDANVLSIGARFISEDFAKRAVQVFLETEFSHDSRHERRIKEIDIDCP